MGTTAKKNNDKLMEMYRKDFRYEENYINERKLYVYNELNTSVIDVIVKQLIIHKDISNSNNSFGFNVNEAFMAQVKEAFDYKLTYNKESDSYSMHHIIGEHDNIVAFYISHEVNRNPEEVALAITSMCYGGGLIELRQEESIGRPKRLIEKITDIREEISTLVAETSGGLSTEKYQKAMMWLNKATEVLKKKK